MTLDLNEKNLEDVIIEIGRMKQSRGRLITRLASEPACTQQIIQCASKKEAREKAQAFKGMVGRVWSRGCWLYFDEER